MNVWPLMGKLMKTIMPTTSAAKAARMTVLSVRFWLYRMKTERTHQ